ncbi:CatA-like O-acetyltransferase [Parasporobacterium paucivorans]|uniref:Chloramphenicol O-acetyltransferase type A n=1 Tax=Parasporobacterium paucivorans DSM 15970 TaxID=1122934 RepID=A0A1M6GGN3_9FIRM|nr:CatA-like O-acetyltransferase [Parasporobacterium paucivorans]SHJ09068.1 chloramphenicol O-acetyltransferase type A [Parasporobacterium paucivorans DSM 15970]
MKIKRLDMDSYPRIKHFEYFRSLHNPYAGVTANVDITELLAEIKSRKYAFFHTIIYLAVSAANQIPQLRQRIEGDEIIEYEHCGASYTVALEDGTYCHCRLDFNMPFKDFLEDAGKRQSLAIQDPSIEDVTETGSLYFVSSVPWVSYTGLTQPTPYPADSNPRITFGRFFIQDGRVLMPTTLLVNHALADGKHIASFFENLENEARTLDLLQ